MGELDSSNAKQIEKLIGQAVELHHQMRYEEASALYMQVLELNPGHLDANYMLGTLHAQFNKLEEAERYLTKAAAIRPDSHMVQVNLGNVFKLRKDYPRALACFEKAVALKNDLLQSHFGKATVLLEMGEATEKVSESLHRALALGSKVPEIHQQFGRLFMRSGDKQALDAFENALRINPDLKEGDRDLGYACLRFGNTADARKHLRRALKKDPEDVFSRYYLAIAEGKEPDDELRNRFVQSEFDDFANHFEKTLTQNLAYDVPARIKAMIEEASAAGASFGAVADLGCGTGLMGELLGGTAGRIVGIDISANMLAKAREKGCYDELVQGDIVDALGRMDARFDCFVATDVVMYLGELEGLIRAALSRALPGALFIFSTERYDGDRYTLQATGRYAHGAAYIRSLSDGIGATIVRQEAVKVRKEWDGWIEGDIFVLRFP